MIKRVIGVFIILWGILLFLSNIKIVMFDEIAIYLWPLLLITIGLVGMLEKKKFSVVYSVIILLGLVTLLSYMGIVKEDVLSVIFVPLLIIIMGINMLKRTSNVNKTSSDQKYYTAIFGGVDDRNIDKNFVECEITSIFGGSKIDFRDMKLKGDKGYINVTSIFGGSELIFSREYKITLRGTPIFGGVDNKLLENNPDAEKEIIINYTAIFGGMDIRN